METANVLRGPLYNARKHWDRDNDTWMLEDATTRETILIGTREQILEEYDIRNNPKHIKKSR